MKFCVIGKQAFASLVYSLLRESEVVGVKRKDGKFVFDNISNPDELCLDYSVTVLPPKKYFLPQKENLLKFKLGERVGVEATVEAVPRIVIGIHPYDIKAIELMDEVFIATNPDPNYIKRRQNTTLIGVDCLNPSPNAFCRSMGTATVDTGFDLMLTDIDGEYVVAIGSERGEWLLRKYVLAREARGEDLAKRDEVRRKALEKYQLSLDVPLEELPSLLERNYDSPLWAELGEKCLSCGSCTLVCPTCVCFDVHDEMELSLTQGVRYREWDSCLLQDFAKVATGENFRGERPNRLRHRLFRKGKYIIERFGKQGCVGCGRCIDACLAEVANPVNAYNRLKEVS